MTPAARAAIQACRAILGAVKPDPWRWKWRNECTAEDRENLLYFSGVPAGNRRRYAQAEWDEMPPELREEVRTVAAGFDALVRLERAGRIRIEPVRLK